MDKDHQMNPSRQRPDIKRRHRRSRQREVQHLKENSLLQWSDTGKTERAAALPNDTGGGFQTRGWFRSGPSINCCLRNNRRCAWLAGGNGDFVNDRPGMMARAEQIRLAKILEWRTNGWQVKRIRRRAGLNPNERLWNLSFERMTWRFESKQPIEVFRNHTFELRLPAKRCRSERSRP